MRRLVSELTLSLLVILAITAWYVKTARSGVPQPGGLTGHTLGIVGFVLMLATETLYTLRKRMRRFTLGGMNVWLKLHIITGLVGPYLVVLHSAGKFNGLAGVVTLLTMVIVASGFVGRYIYTAAPRTLDGVEVDGEELVKQLIGVEHQVREAAAMFGTAIAPLMVPEPTPAGWKVVFARPWLRWRQRRRVSRRLRNLGFRGAYRVAANKLQHLLAERYRLRLQVHSLVATRRLLALWHALHVPLGGVLFALAFIHVGAALYYATLLK